MAKPKPDKRPCQHEMLRSPSHPIADLKCGAPSKFTVDLGYATGPLGVCGRHANFWAVRNIPTSKIQPITPEIKS